MHPSAIKDVRSDFFELVFGDEDGIVCIATAHKVRGKDSFRRFFFEWPREQANMYAFIEQKEKHHNVWFSVTLFDRREAKKPYARPTRIVWADLDTCDPETVDPQPPIIMESSPGRYQAIWTLDGYVDPVIAEEYSRRIAYKYSNNGADVSGWDIGQLLRVPYTHNFKPEYQEPGDIYPVVDLPRLLSGIDATPDVFESIEKPADAATTTYDIDQPADDKLPDVQQTIAKHIASIDDPPKFMERMEDDPDEEADWSSLMWNLINMCFEAGMDEFETFAVCRESKVNKYRRDNRPERHLWLEVLKVKHRFERMGEYQIEATTFTMPKIYDPDTDDNFTYIDMYREWAGMATDAPPQYHDLAAFMVLSAVLSANLKLDTSFGTIRPNLWGMMLGESTLARKTTSLRMCEEILANIDVDLFLTSEGSVEGIISALAHRPHEVSLMTRDELSGYFKQISRKDYLQGTKELFAQLYDVPRVFRRTLKKSTVTVEEPLFMFFGAGIRDEVYASLDMESITSGYLPRFLVVCGDTPLGSVKDIGPPLNEIQLGRDPVMRHAQHLYNTYHKSGTLKLTGQGTEQTIERPVVVNVQLSEEAWGEYRRIDKIMREEGYNSAMQNVALPTMQRLSNSLLKMAMLVAASRSEPGPDNEIWAEKRDIISAAKYVQDWGQYSIEAMLNVGKGVNERLLHRLNSYIRRHSGVSRTVFMRDNHLMKRETDDYIQTLIERGHIRVDKVGKAMHYYSVD